jgi:hypothetical protein
MGASAKQYPFSVEVYREFLLRLKRITKLLGAAANLARRKNGVSRMRTIGLTSSCKRPIHLR